MKSSTKRTWDLVKMCHILQTGLTTALNLYWSVRWGMQYALYTIIFCNIIVNNLHGRFATACLVMVTDNRDCTSSLGNPRNCIVNFVSIVLVIMVDSLPWIYHILNLYLILNPCKQTFFPSLQLTTTSSSKLHNKLNMFNSSNREMFWFEEQLINILY